jgi:hypothetical protein
VVGATAAIESGVDSMGLAQWLAAECGVLYPENAGECSNVAFCVVPFLHLCGLSSLAGRTLM